MEENEAPKRFKPKRKWTKKGIMKTKILTVLIALAFVVLAVPNCISIYYIDQGEIETALRHLNLANIGIYAGIAAVFIHKTWKRW